MGKILPNRMSVLYHPATLSQQADYQKCDAQHRHQFDDRFHIIAHISLLVAEMLEERGHAEQHSGQHNNQDKPITLFHHCQSP